MSACHRIPPSRLIAASLLTCALTGCPLDRQSSSADDTQAPSQGAAATFATAPQAASTATAMAADTDAIGFYDRIADGSERPIRNDLTGTLQGMVQFVQSHSVDPSGNAAKRMPRLTSEREALLLVTPTSAFADATSLTLTATLDGVQLPPVTLNRPEALPKADNPGASEPEIVYSRRAWSTVLPWHWVKPGLALNIVDDRGRAGTLAATSIEFGAPAELIVHNIRIGMLTDPPDRPEDHYMLREPAKAAADYFQTIPAAQLTVSSYEDLKLTRAMVASGVIYDTASATEGGDYIGDMREDIAKDTVSVGINLANWGITSSSMGSQQQPQLTQTVVAHHVLGNYKNGVMGHGLSGGNGMLTLYQSHGNEFSHEIGHHFGLGHHPGAELEPKNFWNGHHADSGWGYIAYRKRMRANLAWHRPYSADTGTAANSFAQRYFYNLDAMSGGEAVSELSRYTHYTGYSTFVRIQRSLSRFMFDPASPSGYKHWNTSTRKMEAIATPAAVPDNMPAVWFNGGTYRPARRHGIPVFTVLGGYDPDNGLAVLYPAARGNWGNVFDLPAPSANASARQCWLQVNFGSRPAKSIALAPQRLRSATVNKLHIQIAQDEAPTSASLQCQDPGAQPRELASMQFPQNLAAMPAPVVIGRDKGYDALTKVEWPELEAGLLALAGKPAPWPDNKTALLIESYSDKIGQLSPAARAQYDRHLALRQKGAQLTQWIEQNRIALDAGEQQAWLNLDRQIESTLGLQAPGEKLPDGGLIVFRDACLKMEQTATGPNAYFAASSTCSIANDAWIIDASGRIRPRARLDLCISDSGNRVAKLSTCDTGRAYQSWDLTTFAPKASRHGRCLSLFQGFLTDGRGLLDIWVNCHQVPDGWQLPAVSQNPMLPITRSDHWQYIERWSRNN